MNQVYKIVWSKALNNWVVTSEKSKGIGKSKNTIQKLMIVGSILTGLSGTIVHAEDILISNQNKDHPNGGTPQFNGNGIDTRKNGVVYEENISGDKNLIFEAPNAKYNATRKAKDTDVLLSELPDYMHSNVESYGFTDIGGGYVRANSGLDDRYGRKMLLDGTNANDFKGDITVRDSAYLYVGNNTGQHANSSNEPIDRNLLGKNNNLLINDYSRVALYSHEELNNLTFSANDASVIYRDVMDKDETLFANIEDKDADSRTRFYGLANDPSGGVLDLTQGSSLIVK